MAVTAAQLGQLVTAMYNFLQNNPQATPDDLVSAVTVLRRRLEAVNARTAANADAAQYGLPVL